MSDDQGSSPPPPAPPTPPAPLGQPAPPQPPAPPAPATPPASPPGWHPDPFGRYDHRWYDGDGWTDQVSSDGQPMTDPMGLTPGPGGPGPFHYQAPSGKNGIAIAGLVCGIIGVLIAWIPFIVAAGIVFAALGLIFGIVGLRRSRDTDRGRGPAIGGIVTGSIGLALSILGIVLSIVFWRALSDFIEPGPVTTEIADCTVDGGFATATGTLTNDSASTRSYTLFVEIDGRSEPITVDDVRPNDTVEWVGRVRTNAATETCEVDLSVNGPFPFGIEIDAIDQ